MLWLLWCVELVYLRLAVFLFAVVFRAADLFAVVLRAAVLLTAVFRAGDLLAVALRAVVLLAAVFLFAVDFFAVLLAVDLRAVALFFTTILSINTCRYSNKKFLRLQELNKPIKTNLVILWTRKYWRNTGRQEGSMQR